MGGGEAGRSDVDEAAAFKRRESLCISQAAPNHVLHSGDDGYREELRRHYKKEESNATEQLVEFKAALQASRTEEEFWPMATEGLAELTGAQYAFISKRMVVDDEDAAVEMPPIGEKGSCLMAQALYFNDGHGTKMNHSNVKYKAYCCPCEFMKHDKVFLIPERLNEFIIDNPNQAGFIIPAEAYLALPLKDQDGKCFAHFGVMWTTEGLSKLGLSWAFIEMMFHSLEDLFVAGFLQRGRFASALKAIDNPNAVIPHEAVTAAQSLKPYARSLSHELRTPMQGVVGMLDVMYATVQEAAEGQNDRNIRAVFETLKENIEIVQGKYRRFRRCDDSAKTLVDSSRRAVEAADNVVHAYDMDMGVPDAPISPPEDDDDILDEQKTASRLEKRPGILVTGEHVPIALKNQKRRRDSTDRLQGKPSKYRKTSESQPGSPKSGNESRPPPRSHRLSPLRQYVSTMDDAVGLTDATFIPPGLRHCNLRDVLQFLVNDLLKVGGRPDSAIAQDREGGEEIEVRVSSPNGDKKIKTVLWTVEPGVPETILIDEQSLVKVISAIYSNAVKFTDEGTIRLNARLSPRSRYVVLTITDTGTGIREEFTPRLFQAFSKEDDSLTRHSEGLGLGLMVAKGLARKLGGDLTLVRTETSGPKRGSEFELRVPVTPGDITSRPSTPSGSPQPPPSARNSPVYSDEVTSASRARPDNRRAQLSSSAVRNALSPRNRSPAMAHGETPSPPRVENLRVTSLSNQAAPKVDNTPSKRQTTGPKRPAHFDRLLAQKYPLTFLVVEDNKINRKLLVNMLSKLGYKSNRDVYEAYDGADAVRQMQIHRENSVESMGEKSGIDVVLMDLWMPFMDGYEACEKILDMDWDDDQLSATASIAEEEEGGRAVEKGVRGKKPTVLAVTADVTDGALERAASVGMRGFLTKPFKLVDLEKLILEYCSSSHSGEETRGAVVM